ncbi:MAG: HD domain-containing protein [Candidatus Aenigmarchaeota archaeon]|nr:HD domain-containing protein [Candidatus Aenigmarchaeota archaeon]
MLPKRDGRLDSIYLSRQTLLEIESLAREMTRNVISVTHDFGHLKRIGIGASWFVKVMGGTKEEQEIAYAAGLLHDIVRPASEKVCHAEASAKESEKILSKLRLDKDTKNLIVQAIKDHRLPVKWVSPLHQSVYLADKILEQMGAFVAFRRCYYVGECQDYKGVEMEEAFRKHFAYRMDRIKKTDFPKSVRRLLDYQWKWLQDFSVLLNKREPWAVRMSSHMFEAAMKRIHLEDAIRSYKPDSKDAERYRKEAMDYLEGKKFGEFEKLVNP